MINDLINSYEDLGREAGFNAHEVHEMQGSETKELSGSETIESDMPNIRQFSS